MKLKYSAQIIWSEQDGVFLAKISELPGCMADGQTQEEALTNVFTVAEEWIEVAKEEGREIPPPTTLEKLHVKALQANEDLQHMVQSAVQNAVNEAIEKQKLETPSEHPGWRFAAAKEFELSGS